MRAALLLFIVIAAACQPCPEIVANLVVKLGDGGVADAGSSESCAIECDTTPDCPRGMHCSLHPVGEHGLCFHDYDAGP